MSNKELIERSRYTVSDIQGKRFVVGFWRDLVTQLCDALEEHEPKPVIRKGEVYAYKSDDSPRWLFGAALEEKPVGRDKSSATDRRKLTADEMPLPGES